MAEEDFRGYRFTAQARWEVGLDDELLELLKRAGFFELALGIEFLEDDSFEAYHKKCTHDDVLASIRNIQRHGLNARGLFILGADTHTAGVGGDRLADFVIDNDIRGMLVQSMYFVPPGTPGLADPPAPADPPGLVEVHRQRCPLPDEHDPPRN